MILIVLISLLVVASIVLLIWALAGLHWEMPEEDRLYLDPLPRILRAIWPLVRFVSTYVGSRLPTPMLEGVYVRIARSGANYMLTAEEFCSVMLIGAVALGGLIYLGVRATGPTLTASFTAFGIVLGLVYPLMWLNKRYANRRKSILKELPIFLDYIVLGMEAGLNFTNAMAQTIEKGPTGALRQEFFLVLRDVRAGLNRSDALRRMDERLTIPEVSSFVSAIVQAEQVGASVGKVLRLQAERRRNERFQRAEKMAMEAPVKLLFPLVVFIFPTTFIVLAFPIVMMVSEQGLF
ncbi:MAG: type II secretion system F family protein [Proteobacteria bacterium]|nr:type II secretion system F family protein [Pseudomonadota bacterium]